MPKKFHIVDGTKYIRTLYHTLRGLKNKLLTVAAKGFFFRWGLLPLSSDCSIIFSSFSIVSGNDIKLKLELVLEQCGTFSRFFTFLTFLRPNEEEEHNISSSSSTSSSRAKFFPRTSSSTLNFTLDNDIDFSNLADERLLDDIFSPLLRLS
uniref:Uncharacterized protein n=1 Tax=Romanomermis culicivorax TaxID=13658 RepID=A0A915KM33_ROMCU